MIAFAVTVLALIVGFWIGWQSHKEYLTGCPTIPDPSAALRVVINVPADFKPLEPLMLDGKPALVGPRALLWYTAYSAAVKAISGNGTYSLNVDEETCAFETARQAVQLVYGSTFDT